MTKRGLSLFLERTLGPGGVLGIGLLLGCAAFYAAGVRPALEQAQELRAEVERAAARAPQRAVRGTPSDALARFYASFGNRAEALAALQLVFDAAAQERVAVEIGEYRVTREAGSRLARYQIVFPVKGDYRAVRRFVARALNEVPGLALDELTVRRESIAAASVEARVQLSLYLAGG